MRARCAGVEVSWMLQTRRTCDARCGDMAGKDLTRTWRCAIGPNAFHELAMGPRSVYSLLGFC